MIQNQVSQPQAPPEDRANKGSRAVGVRGRGTIIFLGTFPLILSLSLFLVFPILYALAMSFTNWNLTALRTPEFTGLANYRRIFEDDLFWTCLRNTIYYALLKIPTSLMLALGLASLINSLRRFRGFFRSVYFFPVLTSSVAAAVIWRWVYQPRFGLLNQIFTVAFDAIGLQIALPRYLTDPRWAMPSVVLMDLWQGVGFTMIIFLAGLQGIPQSLYEASRVDGASRLQTFRHITMPLLRPTIVLVLVTGLIGALQVFDQMFILTEGGPQNATRTVVFMLWEQAFRFQRAGYGSAISFILFFVIVGLTVVMRKTLRTEWAY
jgi:multiple sugar transport system permease protein